jgi:hypothetical protein
VSISGNCNRCGLCCWAGKFKCTNLQTARDGKAECVVYANRRPGMEIILMREDGAWREGICNHGLPSEEKILMPLIEQGLCSLEVRKNDG